MCHENESKGAIFNELPTAHRDFFLLAAIHGKPLIETYTRRNNCLFRN